jgi:hypothetical protein
MSIDNRQSPRIEISRLAFAKEGDKAHGGLLRDVSRNGAFIEFYYPMGRVEHGFKAGDKIELTLDDGPTVMGSAVRIEENGIAVAFEQDDAHVKGIDAMIAADQG